MVGGDKVLLKSDPSIAKNPLIFPTTADARQRPPVRPDRAEQPEVPDGQWQNLTSAADDRLMGFFHRNRGATPYLLLSPGMLLAGDLLRRPDRVPGRPVAAVAERLLGYPFTWAWGNYWDAITGYRGAVRSARSSTPASRQCIALVVSYPVAYWIAFRGGRWKNLLLLFIVAPFFVTYLIRTLAWETILSDHGLVVHTLQIDMHLLAPGGRLLATGDRRGRGHHLQLPALHGAAVVRLARADRPDG